MGANKISDNSLRLVAMALGIVLLFTPFQNCSVYESEDRASLNSKGFPTSGGCAPYIDDDAAKRIMNSMETSTSFLPEGSGPKTCAINTPALGVSGLGNFRCSIDISNADRARNRPTDVTFIDDGSAVAPLFHYSYMRQDTTPSLKTYVITVGALEGRSEGISCGAAFDGLATDAQQAEAARLGLELVRHMTNGTN